MAITNEDIKNLRNRKRIKHKFGAVACEREGIKFPSKLERSCYDTLKALQNTGKILFFLRQIPFDLPGRTKHVIDYCIFTKENVIFLEAKGRDLSVGKLKREQVEEIYNIDVFVVKQAVEIYEVVQTDGEPIRKTESIGRGKDCKSRKGD